MVGIIAESVREFLRGICKEHEVEIISSNISQDHVHMLVSVPPHLSINKLVQYLKGKSSDKMLQENKQMSKMFWGRHLWGRGKTSVVFNRCQLISFDHDRILDALPTKR